VDWIAAERTFAEPASAAAVFVSESILNLRRRVPPAEIIPFDPKSDQEKTQLEPVLQVTGASVPIVAFEELSNLTSALPKEDETRLPENVILRVVRAIPPEGDADRFRIAISSTFVLTLFVVAPSGVAKRDFVTGAGSTGVLVAGAGLVAGMVVVEIGVAGATATPELFI